jgi:hypothetical protein
MTDGETAAFVAAAAEAIRKYGIIYGSAEDLAREALDEVGPLIRADERECLGREQAGHQDRYHYCPTCGGDMTTEPSRVIAEAVAAERRRIAAGVSVDDPAPEEERLGLYRLAAADGALAERERWQAKLNAIRALLTSGPIGRTSGERYIRADLIRDVLDSQPEHLSEAEPEQQS